MAYTFDTIVNKPFGEVIELVTAELKKEGFGILTEIDVKATMKKKLEVDISPYQILGACNPHFAHQAMQQEPKIGAMLPCNVIVRELEPEHIEVSAIDPIASMQAVNNPDLMNVAGQVQSKLKKVIEAISAA